MKRKSIITLIGIFVVLLLTLFTPTKVVNAQSISDNSSQPCSTVLNEVEVFTTAYNFHLSIYVDKTNEYTFNKDQGCKIVLVTEEGTFEKNISVGKVKNGKKLLDVIIKNCGTEIKEMKIVNVIDTTGTKIDINVNTSNFHITNRLSVVVSDSVLIIIYISALFVIINLSSKPKRHSGILLVTFGINFSLFSFYEYFIRPILLSSYNIRTHYYLGLLAISFGVVLVAIGATMIKKTYAKGYYDNTNENESAEENDFSDLDEIEKENKEYLDSIYKK